MDARPENLATASDLSSHSLIEHAEFRSLLSSLSHELCQPLVSLRAGFDLLLGEGARPIPEDQRGHIETMATLCDELLCLTRSYLDYAGMVQGTRPLCLGSYTLAALIREIDRQFIPLAAARRIRWVCVLEGADETVTTDASRCQQIFGNIVANALKYTPEGGEVRMSACREGGSWLITVSDNGPGIPTDSLDRVFTPFYRLPRDAKSRIEGNGLGLAICRELVAQIAGTIALESGPGRGTRVVIRFPIDPSASLAPPRPATWPLPGRHATEIEA
jgi:signal transduction histidine kinase